MQKNSQQEFQPELPLPEADESLQTGEAEVDAVSPTESTDEQEEVLVAENKGHSENA